MRSFGEIAVFWLTCFMLGIITGGVGQLVGIAGMDILYVTIPLALAWTVAWTKWIVPHLRKVLKDE